MGAPKKSHGHKKETMQGVKKWLVNAEPWVSFFSTERTAVSPSLSKSLHSLNIGQKWRKISQGEFIPIKFNSVTLDLKKKLSLFIN